MSEGKEKGIYTNYVEVFKFMENLPQSFITPRNELVLSRKENIYFNLENCRNKKDIEKKIYAWVSRDVYKAPHKIKVKEMLLNAINKYLETNYSLKDFDYIYCKLGNDVNSKLMIDFCESRDTNILCGECRNCKF